MAVHSRVLMNLLLEAKPSRGRDVLRSLIEKEFDPSLTIEFPRQVFTLDDNFPFRHPLVADFFGANRLVVVGFPRLGFSDLAARHLTFAHFTPPCCFLTLRTISP